MTRSVSSAGLIAEALLLGLMVATADATDPPVPEEVLKHRRIQLFQTRDSREGVQIVGPGHGPLPHRLTLEVTGARANAQDWLHDAGFALREERDVEGHRSYTLLSDALATAAPTVQLRAQIGRPQLAAGWHADRNSAAVGITIPIERYAVGFEGVETPGWGLCLLGSVRWHDVHDRIEYGAAVPVTTGRGPGVGVLLQVRLKLN